MSKLIMVTNDDGINSPGLHAAVGALQGLGAILVSAPSTQQTSMSRSFPRSKERGIIERAEEFGQYTDTQAWAVHGSPALSVSHGVLELAHRKPDLVVSGINYGENLGQTVTCSGTVGAALEAYSYNIPSIAISLETEPETYHSETFIERNWDTAKQTLRMWTEWMLKQNDYPPAEILNINVPMELLPIENYRITTLSRQNYINFIKPNKRDFSSPHTLDSKIQIHKDTLEKESDIYAVAIDRMISVTPIQKVFSEGWNSKHYGIELP